MQNPERGAAIKSTNASVVHPEITKSIQGAASEQSLVDDLLAYDERLASPRQNGTGDDDSLTNPIDTDLEELKECVNLLEQLRVSQTQTNMAAHERASTRARVLGLRIGKYELQEFVGRGAFGVVYRAIDESLVRNVALKLPRQEVLFDSEKLKRFEVEATVAASLDHPLIVPVLDANLHDPMPYIASAFCDGPDLGKWLEDQMTPVPPSEAALFIAKLADAVDHAHQRGVLHRDLKPSNVLLTAQGSTSSPEETDTLRPLSAYLPRLTDFGLAKLVEASLEDTRSSLVVGTPLYMAPEQLEGQCISAYPQTDVYALGILLYELLTLTTPFDSDSYVEVLDLVRHQEPKPISSVNRRVPPELDVICQKCLRKTPESRYASAEELSNDLKRYLNHEPIRAKPQTPWERFSQWCHRPERITQAVQLVSVIQLVMIGWVVMAILAIGRVLQGQELSADRMHMVFVIMAIHVPIAATTWIGARRNHRFFYVGMTIAALGQVLIPLMAMSHTLEFIGAAYSRQEFFLLTNFGLVLFAGLTETFLLATAALAGRRLRRSR